MELHIVISRYNENLEWVKKIYKDGVKIFIYNKGEKINQESFSGVTFINLENTGRESQTYLHHIVKFYDSLPDKIIFTQAHPDDHVHSDFKTSILDFLNENLDFKYFSKNILKMKITEEGVEESGDLNGSFWRNKHSLNSCCLTVPSQLIPDISSREWIFGTGAIFGVSRNSINKNPKEFYSRGLEILEKSSDVTNPPEGHAFERSWYLIFN